MPPRLARARRLPLVWWGVLKSAGFNFCSFAGRLGLARLGQARRASGGHPFPAGWWWLSGAQPARAAGRGLRSCPVRPSAQDPDGLTSPVSAAGGILGTFIWARRAHPRWAAPSAGGLRGRPGEIKVPKTPQRPRPTVGRPLKRSENYLSRKSIRGADAHPGPVCRCSTWPPGMSTAAPYDNHAL